MGEDLFIEVSHGPTLVDNNIFLSVYTGKLATQGVAYVHNLRCGAFTSVGSGTDNGPGGVGIAPRYTPYHVPHRTEVVDFPTNKDVGTFPFDDYPTEEEYRALFYKQSFVGGKRWKILPEDESV